MCVRETRSVSLLSIDWQPGVVRMLLGSHAAPVSRLLAEVRDDIDLWEASDEDLAPVDELWQTLNAGFPSIMVGSLSLTIWIAWSWLEAICQTALAIYY